MRKNLWSNRNVAILGILLYVISLTACNALATSSAPTATIGRPTRAATTPTTARTATMPPTLAVIAPSVTTAPTRVINPVPPPPTVVIGALPFPTGAPIASWHNFPVMPGALAGQDNNKGGYYYSVNATPKQIEDYYTLQMKNLGWDLMSRDTKSNDPGYLSLIFYQANYPTLTVFVSAQGNTAVIFLAN